jgi:hypothetical protein
MLLCDNAQMLMKAFCQSTKQSRLIGLALVFALLFATAHLAHEHDVLGAVDGQEECQVCRLSHVPALSLSVPSLLTPLSLFAYALPVAKSKYQLSRPFYNQWARAPPLS